MSKQNGQTSLPAIAKQQIQTVEKRVKQLQQDGQLDLPPDYSASNALRSAFLTLQEVKDMQKKPALEVCTAHSISNALLDMVVQGLTPSRSQGYFICYGQQLAFQRSYFGDMALAKRIDSRIADIFAEVIHDGDEFEFEIVRGQKKVTRHKQTIDSLNSEKIKGAYCVVLDHDGQEISTVIMSWKEILASWKKSPSKPFDEKGNLKPGSTHALHTEEMAKRTVVRKACKPIINSGADSYLRAAVNRSEHIQAQSEAETQAALHANQGEVVDAEFHAPEQPAPDPDIDPDTGEALEYRQETEQAAEPEPAMAEAEPGF